MRSSPQRLDASHYYDERVNAVVAGQKDAGLLGRSIAIAYRFNPLVLWKLADDSSEPRFQGLFTALIDFGIQSGLVYRTHDGDGAPMLAFAHPGGPGCAGRHNRYLSMERGRRDALAALSAARPTEPHCYLDALSPGRGSQ